jgi:hypothetical protein
VKAVNELRLHHRRGGFGPAFLAPPDRVDQLEVIEIASGEIVLFWDLAPRDAARRARVMTEDLQTLETIDFLAKWSGDL